MMPEEWPIAAHVADETGGARFASRGRLSTVRRDFFLDPVKRLTEQERALMTAMIHALVSDVASALRAALPGGKVAANDDGDTRLIATLTTSGLLNEPGLMALLVRRAEEERISTAARARSGCRAARLLQGLVSHDYGAVAAAAMALILGRGRRRDRFGQGLIAFDDLPAASAGALACAVAAGLRRELAASRGIHGADAELAAAVEAVLRNRDEERGIDALTASLVHFLEEADSLTDELVLAAAHEGEISFVAETVAQRSSIPTEDALDEMLSGEPRHVMVLLRAAGLSRELVAGLLAGVGDLLGIADAGETIGVFDGLTDADAHAARSWLDTDPAYRAALDRLGQGRG
jgi:hypothetical protein